MIHQDTNVQTELGTEINKVVAFNKRLKIKTEIANEAIISIDFFLHHSDQCQRMIGKIGKTQGAKIVNTPAKKEINNNSILIH